jgi:hypothetical protein
MRWRAASATTRLVPCLQALPLCGGFGFCQAMAALAGGAVIVMQPTFEAEETALHKPGGLNAAAAALPLDEVLRWRFGPQ